VTNEQEKKHEFQILRQRIVSMRNPWVFGCDECGGKNSDFNYICPGIHRTPQTYIYISLKFRSYFVGQPCVYFVWFAIFFLPLKDDYLKSNNLLLFLFQRSSIKIILDLGET